MKKNMKKMAVLLAIMTLLATLFSFNCFAEESTPYEIMPVAAELTLNPDYDENTILKEVIKYIGAIIALVGVVAGIYFIAQGSYSEQPEKKKQGIEVLVTCLCAAGLIVMLSNMIIK